VRGTSYIVIVAPASVDDQASAPTSIVLLTDRNGHVGRVDVAATGSTALAVPLSNAGDAATSGARDTTAASLDPSSLAQLEAVAHVRNDRTASRTTEQQARAIAAKLVLPVVPAAEDRPGTSETRQDGSGNRGSGAALPVSSPGAEPQPRIHQSVAAQPTTPQAAPVRAPAAAPVSVPRAAAADRAVKPKDNNSNNDKGGKKP
jgi:hypothetical protein